MSGIANSGVDFVFLVNKRNLCTLEYSLHSEVQDLYSTSVWLLLAGMVHDGVHYDKSLFLLPDLNIKVAIGELPFSSNGTDAQG